MTKVEIEQNFTLKKVLCFFFHPLNHWISWIC